MTLTSFTLCLVAYLSLGVLTVIHGMWRRWLEPTKFDAVLCTIVWLPFLLFVIVNLTVHTLRNTMKKIRDKFYDILGTWAWYVGSVMADAFESRMEEIALEAEAEMDKAEEEANKLPDLKVN